MYRWLDQDPIGYHDNEPFSGTDLLTGGVSYLITLISYINSSFWYGRVYLPLCKVADTPFHIQWDELYIYLLI